MISALARQICPIVMAEGDPATFVRLQIWSLNSDFNDVPEILFEAS